MKSAIGQAVNPDNGLTDYSDAFAAAGAQNPNATARIFLTDGGHNNEDSSPYNNSHRGGPPGYVIGLAVVGDGGQVLNRSRTRRTASTGRSTPPASSSP